MHSKTSFLSFLFVSLTTFLSFAQSPKSVSAGEILHEIQKLKVVGNVLYVAAHPDDENTLFLTYLSKERKVRTAYIAMTRGDGGQNLVGDEQDEYVGLLRTHELLAARGVDGAEQYFTRAKDYGFTKTTGEALDTWKKEEILSDLVLRIRLFKPDVIVNRFPPDQRAGHGHHSASAVLSAEAFKAAADPNRFPEQLTIASVWQASRLVWNSFSPGFQNKEPDGPFIKVNLGDYNPLLGKSYTEIAAEARSMHRSQGFGSAKTRNQRSDFALHVLGDTAKTDLFDGIDITWNRIKNGGQVEKMIDEVIQQFDLKKPSKSAENLINVLTAIETLPKDIYTEQKANECKQIIAHCLGLWYETQASETYASAGQVVKLNSQVTNRSDLPITLKSVQFEGFAKDSIVNKVLKYNEQQTFVHETTVPANAAITQPYWLKNPYEKGIYKVDDLSQRGLPMAAASFRTNFIFDILGKEIQYTLPINYKYVEPSEGEIYKYFEIRPKALLNIELPVYAFGDKTAKEINLKVRASQNNLKGKVKLYIPSGWAVSPAEIPVDIKTKDGSQTVVFKLTPPAGASESQISAVFFDETGEYNRSLHTIDYKHIPQLNTFPLATAKVLKIDLKKKGNLIGYISGTGDKVPQALEQIGYKVVMLGKNLDEATLKSLDALVVGVRAYNTEDYLKDIQDKLIKYVENGGTMIVQYQTNAFYGGLKLKNLGPYPFNITNARVADETAEVKILKPQHKLLNSPNLITPKDFDNWVQERGLYFANQWDGKYETIFSMKDPNETDQEGSLLYSKYGKGTYIFTSMSFFRQLPAGVPGAFRLFSNLISAGK